MFIYKRVIRIQDTDTTGALYFANQFQIGLEAFEEFLFIKDFSLSKMIIQKKFFFPVVHAEADFFAPLYVGDLIKVTLSFELGHTSFKHHSDIFKEKKKIGDVSIVHAVVCPDSKSSIPIPDALKTLIFS